jgi:hypothetical protein
MHKNLLQKEKWRWYWQDVFIPLASSAIVVGFCRIVFTAPPSQFMMILYLMIIAIATYGVTAFVTPITRIWVSGQFLRIKLLLQSQ